MASLAKAARKLKRTGKSAAQFKFTSTFEYIELSCNSFWRPDKLKVIWLRNHRRVESIAIPWVVSEDRGPNGADGKATFNPALSVSLIVTLYRAPKKTNFEDKEYKFYIESEGPGGKKILASFNCDMAEYAAVPSAKEALDMTFKSVSKKVNKAVLGITLESEFVKEGNSLDDDMQSTFSAFSVGQDSLLEIEDEDEDEDDDDVHKKSAEESGAVVNGVSSRPPNVVVEETAAARDPVVQSPDKDKDSLVVLGTGATLKRDTLPLHAPSKPPRTGSFRRHHTINRGETESERLDKPPSGGQESVQTHKTDTDVTGKEEAGELAMVNETKELPSKEEERGAGGNGPEVKVSDSSMPGDDGDRRDEITVNSLPVESDSVEVVEKSPSVENSLPVVPHDVAGEAGSQSLEKSSPVVPHGVAGEAGSQSLEKSSPVAPHSVAGEAGSQIVENSLPVAPINGHHEKPAAQLPPDTTKDDKELQNGNGSQVNTKEDKKQDGGGNVKHTEEHPSSEKTVPPRVESSTTDLTTTTSDKATESDSDSKLKDSKSHSDDSAENQSLTRKSSFGVSNGTRLEDSLFDTALLLAEADKTRDKSSPPVAKQRRKNIESKEVYKAPPNPYIEEEDEEAEASPPPVSPTLEWLEEVPLINCFNEAVPRSKIDSAEIIGLYFSAKWCPPCRKFLPKLINFYHQLKQHNKSFEIIYLSSDYSKADMLKYMVEQQMPWVAMEYGSQIVETLKAKFNVKAIPLLTIVSTKGMKIEESAKKSVEGASSAAAAIKLYNKWQKLLAPENESESGADSAVNVADTETKERKGILSKVKNHIRSKGKHDTVQSDGGGGGETDAISQKSVDDHTEIERLAVEEKVPRTKSIKSRNKSGGTVEQLEEKEERIRHLEAVNITLKQTNDDLNEEVTELRRQLTEQADKIKALESTHQRLEDERRTLAAHMNIRGWLFKRGVKGPTANIWRRRYFRCDQGSRICYYKSSAEGTPQGFIDLDKVISVQEVSAAQQDKNHATFLVQCDGRTFQLQGHDEATMRKWMSAIEYLKNYRQGGGASISVDGV